MRNELVWAFPALKPIVPGHILICPVRCVATFEELTLDEQKVLFEAMTAIKKSLQKVFHATGFNHAWNENIVAGQTIPHLHLHVLPRTEEDEVRYGYEPRQFLYRPTADRMAPPQQELIEVAHSIAANL